jgi:hypothetical protein
MLESRLVDLKRGGHGQDRAARLGGHHAPGGERAAIADAIDLVLDRHIQVAAAQEVRVQRVNQAIWGNRLRGRGERLAEDLPAKDPAPPEVLAAPSKRSIGATLERQEIHELA